MEANDFVQYYVVDCVDHHPLLSYPGVSPQCFGIDGMHCFDCSGISGHVGANCIMSVLKKKQLKPPHNVSKDAGIAHINAEAKQWYVRE